MSDRYPCCGRKKSWSWNNHAPDCRNARRAAKVAHPAQTAISSECPVHPGEDRFECRPCEAYVEEQKERVFR